MSKLKPCPKCGSEELEIDSCRSLCISQVFCNEGSFSFQSKAYEENIYKYWNKLDRKSSKSDEEKLN